MDEDKLREAFAKFDTDGSGLIDSAELKTALRSAYIDCSEEISDEDLEQLADKIMAAVDTSGDGKVSLEEFINAIQSNCAELTGQLAAAAGEDDGQEEEQDKDDE